MKKTLLMATGALMAAGFAADAKAVDVELYGQVNKTLIAADNGTDSEVAIRDNDKSSTRVGLKGEQMLDNGLTASVLVEYELNGDDTQTDDLFSVANTSSAVTERHARVGVSGHFGTVLLGHTSTATDGIAEIDLAGVSDILGSDVERFGGASTFVQKSGTTADVSVSTVFDNFDGGRADVIAYHSPVVSGLQAKLSTSEGGDVQAAVRYSGKYDAFAVKAGIGYTSYAGEAEGVNSETVGSVSVKHDSGIAATFAYGTEETENSTVNPESDSMYFKVGYAFDAFEIAADYAKHDTDDAVNTEGTAMGIGGQYNLGHGVSVSAAYRNLEVEKDAASYDEIDLIMANVRVKF